MCPCAAIRLGPVPQHCGLGMAPCCPESHKGRSKPCSSPHKQTSALAPGENCCSSLHYVQLRCLLPRFIRTGFWECRWVYTTGSAFQRRQSRSREPGLLCEGENRSILCPSLCSSDSMLLPSMDCTKMFWFCLKKNGKEFLYNFLNVNKHVFILLFKS